MDTVAEYLVYDSGMIMFIIGTLCGAIGEKKILERKRKLGQISYFEKIYNSMKNKKAA